MTETARQPHDTNGKLELLLNVSMLLGKTLDPAEVLQASIDSAVNVTGLDTGAIYLLDEDTLFLGAATPPLGPDFPTSLRTAVLSDHPHVKRAIDTQTAYFIGSLLEAPLAPEEMAAADARDLRSMLYVPLIADAKPLGVFLVGAMGRTAEMSQADVDLCKTLASMISLAVSNARLFESLRTANDKLSRAYQEEVERQEALRALATDITIAEEKQRRELAVELRERVGGPLSEVGRRLAQASDTGQSNADLKELTRLLDRTIAEVGVIASETSPPFIFDKGLSPAIEWLCQRAESHALHCDVFADGDLSGISEDARLLAFQAVRELLANTVQHAHAQNVVVTVDRSDGMLAIRVSDDGRGFPSTEVGTGPVREGGFGLFSLRERLSYLGGSLDVASSLGAGTIVDIRIPIQPQAHGGELS